MALTNEDYEWVTLKRSHQNESDIEELGFFGNIWVRSHLMRKAGDTNGNKGGHYHVFDHVTLLVKGSIKVEVEGYEPTRYVAPTFITIKKDKHHLITALEDDTIYYCVFAMRDVNGDITDVYSPQNTPYITMRVDTKEQVDIFQGMFEANKRLAKLKEETILKG